MLLVSPVNKDDKLSVTYCFLLNQLNHCNDSKASRLAILPKLTARKVFDFHNNCISMPHIQKNIFLLFVLMLKVPVNKFPVMSGRTHLFLGIPSTFQGVNVSLTAEVGIEPPNSS